MKQLLSIAILILPLQLFAQWGDCNPSLDAPFGVGEKLSYELVYNWGFIWAKAGKVDFEVRDSILHGKSHYHFYSYGSSYRGWDWFYKVRSTYQSLVDEEFRPVYFSRIGREGSNQYMNIYELNGNSALFSTMDEEGRISRSKFELAECAYDVISGIYYCRSLDFSGLEENEVIPLNLYLDGDNFKSQLRYVGKRKLEDDRLSKSYDCIVFKPLLIEGTVFSEGENMTVYVSDDDRRVPIYIETDLVVGKAKIYLMED
jgi:hypothetical protein